MCEISIVYSLDGALGQMGAEELARMMATGSAVNSHGWGMFSDDNHVVKKPAQFRMAEERATILKDYGDKGFAIGHVRYATHGKHIDENTHPLTYKNWTMVHNGVIQNQADLRKKHGMPRTPEVDSYVVLWLVNKHYMDGDMDIEKAIKLTCSELKGWYSVFLFDRDSKRLYYFRNGADFNFRLIVTDDGQHYIVGNTKKENAAVAFSKMAWGFRITAARTLGWIHPKEDALYEISDTGISILCDLPAPAEDPAAVTYIDAKDWAEYLDGMNGKRGPCGTGKDTDST